MTAGSVEVSRRFSRPLVVSRCPAGTGRVALRSMGDVRLFADVNQWPGWVKVACQTVPRGDTEKLGRVAEHFNNKLQEAVRRANEALGSERVIFVDRFALYRDGLHELCGTNEDWLNGPAVDRGQGPGLRYQSSFHPNRAGHEGVSARLIEQVNATFPPSVQEPPTYEELLSADIPEMCGHQPTTLVDGNDVKVEPHDGYFRLNETLSAGSPGWVSFASPAGPMTAVVASCSAGGVGWPNVIMFIGPGPSYYAQTFLDDYDWRAIGLNGPGRDAIRAMRADGGRLVVDVGMYLGNEGECCWSGSALVAVEPRGGNASIVAVSDYDVGPAVPVVLPNLEVCALGEEVRLLASSDRFDIGICITASGEVDYVGVGG